MDEACYPWSLTRCTFYGNGVGVWSVTADARVTIENTIIAYNTEGPALPNPYPVVPSCCDFYGNAGGDWLYLEDYLGVNGNICADPLFCDPANGDFHLSCHSPCAPFSPPNDECDLIGAWPVGCGLTPARVVTWGGLKRRFRE